MSSAVTFDRAIAVDPLGEGRYAAESFPEWDALFTTHGGVLAAVAVRAFEAEFNPDAKLQIRSLTCHYYRPPEHGRFEVVVEPMRTGKRVDFARLTMVQDGSPFLSALAVYTHRGQLNMIEFQPSPPKTAPPPARDAETVPFEEYKRDGGKWIHYGEQAPRFLQQVHGAPQIGHGPFMGPEEVGPQGTENGGWVQPADPRPVDDALLVFYADLFWPSVFQAMRTLAIAPTLDFTVHFRTELPPGGLPDQPLLIHNTTAASLECVSDSDSRIYDRDGRLLAQARQLQLLAPRER
jgi:acyl-CoA thioesterase